MCFATSDFSWKSLQEVILLKVRYSLSILMRLEEKIVGESMVTSTLHIFQT